MEFYSFQHLPYYVTNIESVYHMREAQIFPKQDRTVCYMLAHFWTAVQQLDSSLIQGYMIHVTWQGSWARGRGLFKPALANLFK